MLFRKRYQNQKSNKSTIIIIILTVIILLFVLLKFQANNNKQTLSKALKIYQQGNLLMKKHKFEKAQQMYLQALANTNDPREKVKIYYHLAYIYAAENNVRDTIRCFQKIIATNIPFRKNSINDNAHLYKLLSYINAGNICIYKNNITCANSAFNACIEYGNNLMKYYMQYHNHYYDKYLNSYLATCYEGLAVSNILGNKKDEAEKDFETALEFAKKSENKSAIEHAENDLRWFEFKIS